MDVKLENKIHGNIYTMWFLFNLTSALKVHEDLRITNKTTIVQALKDNYW